MNRRNRLILVTLLLLGLSLAVTGCDDNVRKMLLWVTQSSVNKSSPQAKKLNLNVRKIGKNNFAIQAHVPGPPYPPKVFVGWRVAVGGLNPVVNTEPSHPEYISSQYGATEVSWELPVDPNTGLTPEVTVKYEFNGIPSDFPVDEFHTLDPTKRYIENAMAIVNKSPEAGLLSVAAQPAQPSSAQDDTSYLRQVWEHFWPTSAMTMTASICQDQVDLLQSGNTFFALRFPVSPTLPYTAPYPLPLVTGPITYTPRLTLKYASAPYTSVLTVPLELKPGYLGFLENKMPQAPSEHWLAMGAVTTPTVSCSSVPTMTNWMFEAEFWLDLGGTPDAGMGATLPLYDCYKGQTPPPFVGLASYQDWGITCLGPQPIFLEDVPRIELAGTHSAWITPTQTITFYHPIRNWTGITRTVTITHTSTPTLPWQFYTAFESDPTTLVPITDTIDLPASFWKIRPLWAKVTVPEDAPAGAATLVITATDVTSPTLSTWTSDLVWVGEWVAPSPPPWEKHKVYLLLMLRNR
jgi:hypothetical protein